MGRGAFLPIGGGGTRLGCFLVGGGDGNAGLATTLELFTTVTFDFGADFFELLFLLVDFLAGELFLDFLLGTLHPLVN